MLVLHGIVASFLGAWDVAIPAGRAIRALNLGDAASDVNGIEPVGCVPRRAPDAH
jgi:hypothetical protein